MNDGSNGVYEDQRPRMGTKAHAVITLLACRASQESCACSLDRPAALILSCFDLIEATNIPLHLIEATFYCSSNSSANHGGDFVLHRPMSVRHTPTTIVLVIEVHFWLGMLCTFSF